MAKKKIKYYVVWKGHQPGIYHSWAECKKQIEGFPDAKYKGFEILSHAEEAFKNSYQDYYSQTPKVVNSKMLSLFGDPPQEALCVDAACSGKTGILEYRGILYPAGTVVFHRGPFPEGTNNIGEFLAIVTGLSWLVNNNSKLELYSDSRTGIAWVKQKKINTKLERNDTNEKLFQIIDKALLWLHENGIQRPIRKWETEAWGEIPADFGRK